MNNKLQPIPPNGMQPANTPNTNNFNGSIDTFVAHTEAVQNNYYLGGPSLPTDAPAQCFGAPPKMDTNFYNLFVLTSETFNSGNCFSISKELALKDTDDDIVSALTMLGEQELIAIRSFPTIVATKNHGCGSTSRWHLASYGFLNNILVRDSMIQFYFSKLNDISQQTLITNADRFCIGRASAYNEFDRPHWSVKRLNIVDALKCVGVTVAVIA